MYLFQSTLPSRGATFTGFKEAVSCRNFYPRSPRGERRRAGDISLLVPPDFYPRSPRGERLLVRRYPPIRIPYFYPRSPRGERLIFISFSISSLSISIHAPLAGSDSMQCVINNHIHIYFNPRSPRGERQTSKIYRKIVPVFQSTLPSRGATAKSVVI